MNISEFLTDGCQDKYQELKPDHESLDWESFHNGWVEGRFEALKPKPLEWDEEQSSKSFAPTPIGMYVVGATFTGDVFAAVPLDLCPKYFVDIAEAKAYCERHYKNLVLSMLKD